MKSINDDILYDIDNSINNNLAKHRIQQEREKLDYEKQYYIKEIERLNNKIEKNRKFIIKIVNDLIIPCYDEERLKKYMNIDNKYVLDLILKYYDSYSNDEYLLDGKTLQ